MFKQRKRVDDDDDDDDDSILRDGESLRVPLHMMDAVQRSVAQHLHDGHGNRPGHRPGFAMSDANDDARQRAYDEYRRDIENAWRSSGAEGTPDELQRDALPARDDMALDELQCDHQRRMSCEYQAYDSWIEHQWRNP